MSMSTHLPLQGHFWSGALNAGDRLRRCGLVVRRFARIRLEAVRQASATRRPVDAAEAAADVRALAMRHLKSDPGFAAELFAAAARHETAAGG